jgi:uncharacterized membrane protein (DUF373 family)
MIFHWQGGASFLMGNRIMDTMWTSKRLVVSVTSVIGMIIVGLLLAVAIYLTILDTYGFIQLILDTDPNVIEKGLILEFIGAVLLIIICLELVETVFSYSISHHLRVEVVLLVGMTAIVREIIVIDIKTTEAAMVAALGGVVVAIAGAYYLVERGKKLVENNDKNGN